MPEFKKTLETILNRNDLDHDTMLSIMRKVMRGELTSAQIAGLTIALRMKGETVDEIAAAAEVMRELSSKVKIGDHTHLIDTCGTGGDSIQTFNISTACAFVAAAAGAKVAKHGGRSVSSTCGSADVLEKLGLNVNQAPDEVAKSIEDIGIGFMFAPNHHSAMKHAAPVRKELGVRTIFNLLGPLTNPANAKRQIMGVFDRKLTSKLASVLKKLGSTHVLVVHGADGMDEISFSGETFIAELKNGIVNEYIIKPEMFSLTPHKLEDIQVKTVDESKNMILDVLNGKHVPARDIVLLNAGAAIYVSGLAENLGAGIVKAAKVIDNGASLRKLNDLIAKSNETPLTS